MTQDALNLAALASAAVPGLSPIRAEAVQGRAGERFQVGFVEDIEHRRWVVRVPRDAVAAARQDASVVLLGMLARRVPFAVPAPKGFAALRDGRRAMVYPLISGHALSFYALPPGPGLAAELGRAIAHLHNVDRRLFEEAAVPVYDSQECRRRHQTMVDRAAQTGHVPVGLLARWERLFDDVSLWRFAPAPVHGRLDGPHVLASFSSGQDAASGRIRAVVGWEDAMVADPAEDFAALVATAAPETLDTVLEAYAMSRLESPDPRLEQRARLVAELRLVGDLLLAQTAKDQRAVAAATEALRVLDAEVGDPDAPAPEGVLSGIAIVDDASAPDHWYSSGEVTPVHAVADRPDADGQATDADREPEDAEPVHADGEPVHADGEPVHAEAEPVHTDGEPADVAGPHPQDRTGPPEVPGRGSALPGEQPPSVLRDQPPSATDDGSSPVGERPAPGRHRADRAEPADSVSTGGPSATEPVEGDQTSPPWADPSTGEPDDGAPTSPVSTPSTMELPQAPDGPVRPEGREAPRPSGAGVPVIRDEYRSPSPAGPDGSVPTGNPGPA